MRAQPFALLRLAAGASLFITGNLVATSLSHAEAAVTRFESNSSARILSDDPAIDQHLAVPVIERQAPAASVKHAPAASPQHAPAAPVAAARTHAETEPHQEVAAIGPAMRPLRTAFEPVAPAKGIITTYFGEVGGLSPRGHAGVDVAAPVGTPIFAMEDGEVLRADFGNAAYGGLIVIAHADGYETWYGHLSQLGVEPGDRVTRGAQIGGMGSTGMSTGSHLHFEVRQEGELRNPMRWLSDQDLEKKK
jgi:murein DD-endopeptidase MepM/ murein hydrolase activator NlpD